LPSLKNQMRFTILLSALGLIVVLSILYFSINKFLIHQEVVKSRLLGDTIIAFRTYLATVAPRIKVMDNNLSPFSCSPAYVVNQVAKIIAKEKNFYLRQVSDKYRNPKDKPNSYELKAIEYFKTHPNVKEFWELHMPHRNFKSEIGREIHIFYAKPLITQKNCLKCHGVPKKDVPERLYKKLVKMYGDRAFNYKEGDIRGIISIVIPYSDLADDVNRLFFKLALITLLSFLIGTFIFFRIYKKIENSINEILNYFKENISKGIYTSFKKKMNFLEFENLKREINATITTIKKYQGKLYEKLYYHPLSRLPNRVKFFEILKQKKNPLAIINIDKFRDINAYFGPETADKLIQEISKRLKELSKNYHFKVFHLDIDEFALLFPKDISKEDLLKLVKELLKELEEPYKVKNNEIIVKFRSGISYYKKDYIRAETALDMAKTLRRDIVFGEEALANQKTYEEHLKWFKKLKKALDNDKIIPFYQPIVDRDKNIIKYEALVRLIDEDGKVVSPFFFLEVAKRTRLYLEITRRVVDKAFEKFQSKPVGVSINLDLSDIEDTDMREYILKKITHSDVKVTFEMVENEDVRESDIVKSYLRMLQKIGAEIYIDDFGSGYANFDYLIKLNPNGVKIDGSLVKDILTNKNNEIMIKTIVNFAKEVGIKTVAEFVENEEIFEKLKSLGVDYFQGYYFSPPKPDIEG